MLRDITVDTNVFMHAENPKVPEFDESVLFVEHLLASETELCIDEADQPPSLIQAEYIEHLSFGGVGMNAIVELADQSRIREVHAGVAAHHNQWLARRIGDPRDRTFVKVAANSHELVLVSHDTTDFSNSVRGDIEDRFDVVIEDASCANTRMNEP